MNEGGSTIINHESNNADEDKIEIRFRGTFEEKTNTTSSSDE